MRQSQKSNRSRGRGNRKGGGGGGGNNLNRVYDSAGPEGKVRGTPQQIIDKYLALARDAQTSGDRVAAENFLQHAEHYQRILISAMTEQEKARREAAERMGEDPDEDGSDDDIGGDGRDDGPREASRNNDHQRGPRDDGPRNRRNGRAPQPAESEEIDGMTTIDSGDEADPGLIVAPEEITRSQPRGNARRSRRRPNPAEDGEAPAAEASETATEVADS